MRLLFSDNHLHHNFRPLTLTRPISELRFGILTITESWCLSEITSNTITGIDPSQSV